MRKQRGGSGLWATVALTSLAVLGPPAARAQVKLEYKFPEGEKRAYKTTSRTSQVLTLMGQDIATESKQTVITSSTVGKKRADNTLPIEEKVESLATEITLPGGMLVTFDSKDPNPKVDNPQLGFLVDLFKLVSQMGYTVVLDDHNKVKAVEGAEKILEKADALNEMAKQMIRSRVDAEHLKQQFEQAHSNLPDVLARPGEPWERVEVLNLEAGQTLTFHKKYEYAGTEKVGGATLDKITSTTTDVKYQMDPNSQSPLKVTKSDLKVESADGTIYFDHEKGRVVTASGKTQIKGPMTFNANGQEIPGSLNLTIETKQELQPAAK